jgi:hypothetical protein
MEMSKLEPKTIEKMELNIYFADKTIAVYGLPKGFDEAITRIEELRSAFNLIGSLKVFNIKEESKLPVSPPQDQEPKPSQSSTDGKNHTIPPPVLEADKKVIEPLPLEEPHFPEKGDYVIKDSVYAKGRVSIVLRNIRFLTDCDNLKDARHYIRKHAEQNDTYPNVWRQDVRGDCYRLKDWTYEKPLIPEEEEKPIFHCQIGNCKESFVVITGLRLHIEKKHNVSWRSYINLHGYQHPHIRGFDNPPQDSLTGSAHQVYTLIKREEGIYIGQIMDILELGRVKITEILKDLEEKKFVYSVKEGRVKRFYSTLDSK